MARGALPHPFSRFNTTPFSKINTPRSWQLTSVLNCYNINFTSQDLFQRYVTIRSPSPMSPSKRSERSLINFDQSFFYGRMNGPTPRVRTGDKLNYISYGAMGRLTRIRDPYADKREITRVALQYFHQNSTPIATRPKLTLANHLRKIVNFSKFFGEVKS